MFAGEFVIDMNLINKEKLDKFGRKNRTAKKDLESWCNEVENAHWTSPHELKKKHSDADPIGNGVTVFNIMHNQFRLVAKCVYKDNLVIVRWIGNHSDYDRLNAKSL